MRVGLKTKAAEVRARPESTPDEISSAESAASYKPLPQFTSCCPGWINWIEINRPDLLSHLSTTKSPQMMLGAVAKRGLFPNSTSLNAPRRTVDATKGDSATRGLGDRGNEAHGTGGFAEGKEDVYCVSIMPCTAKKDEAKRPSMTNDVDAVLTTRELARMIRAKRIPFASLPNDGEFDSPIGESTGAAAIFGASGGVMEAALRTASFVLAQKAHRARVEAGEAVDFMSPAAPASLDFHSLRGTLPGVKVATIPGVGDVAVCNGIASAQKLLENDDWKKQFLAIEVMTCVGGCLGGGGEPKSDDPDILQKRAQGIYGIDKDFPKRCSHENQQVLKLYEEFLEAPLSHTSERLLHTSYAARHSERDLLGKFLGAVDRYGQLCIIIILNLTTKSVLL